MAQRKHNAKPGDLIEFDRSVYKHWAVYVGDDYVVHLTFPDDKDTSTSASLSSFFNPFSFLGSVDRYGLPRFFRSSGFFSFETEAEVKYEDIWEVAKGCDFRVNNLLDDKYMPRDPDDIVEEARWKVGETLHYSLNEANCEHFATDMRYGKAESRQGPLAAGVVGASRIGMLVAMLATVPEVASAIVVKKYYDFFKNFSRRRIEEMTNHL